VTSGEAGGGVLYVIVCGAGPAPDVGKLVRLAQDRGWQVQIVATPAGLAFIDKDALEKQTGNPVRSQYRVPGDGQRSLPAADAIIVAPATYNTVNKWSLGISDTYALGILAESIGLGIPVVVVPFVNTALASRVPFRHAVAALRAEGVRIILGPDELEPHPPGTGGARVAAFPWAFAIDEAEQLAAMDS
jgi:phosphopantothenoylcysteine synthetase/decarboxylase